MRHLVFWLASCCAEQLSVHISPFAPAGSVQPICSGGSDCRQALTATFSRAMIALGEDFGAGLEDSPFYKAINAAKGGTMLVVDRDAESLNRIWRIESKPKKKEEEK